MKKLYINDATEARITSDLMKQREHWHALANAWRNVKRLHKKDGGEFAVYSKNWSGFSRIAKEPFLLLSKELRMMVCTRDAYYTWREDDISNIDTNVSAYDQTRVIKEPTLVPYVVLTPDEIDKRIAERVKLYEQRVKDLDKLIPQIPQHLAEYVSAYAQAFRAIDELPNTTVYAIERELHLD